MNDYYVYMHISPSGKRYVGITCQKPEKRWKKNGYGYKRNKHFYNAINKYGWDNFEHIIITKGLSEDEAKWLEIELIREWDTTNKEKGYNITLGGEGTKGVDWRDYTNEETISEHNKKISEAMTNNPNHPMKTPEVVAKFKGKNNPMAKSVICITMNKVFKTIKEGEEYYNCSSHISECCDSNNKRKSCGKLPDGTPLVWMYLEDYENATEEEIQQKIQDAKEAKSGKNSPHAIAVICLTTGKIFSTITDAMKEYNIKGSSDIGNCCKGWRLVKGERKPVKSVGKYNGKSLKWKYLNDFLNLCEYTIL